MRAPELPSSLEWINTDAPLTLGELRGKVVLLDFWTYCCINCMHILPDLRYLEEKYSHDLVVIGLHSPKFANERVNEQLALAIGRYDIRHPVANDPMLSVWQQYRVHAWPTLVLIDTNGNIVSVFSGEGHRQQLDQLIHKLINDARNENKLAESSASFDLKNPEIKGNLAFPGKILATKDRLYISDSGHHRVLETDLNGKILRKFGCGVAGLQDGPAAEVRFKNPQGLTLHDNKLFVADTDNHVIRCISLATDHVATYAGTGEMGMYQNSRSILPLHSALNSPWDVEYHHDYLYIAMAGCHQIWRIHLESQRMEVWAGSGIENIADGSPSFAAFAQPSGLSANADDLFVADSESSAIRKVSFNGAYASTLIGKGLFEYGDRDGVGLAARLQHPLGVGFDENLNCLWVADTYNHKIKKYELESQIITQLKLDTLFNEPGGISYLNKQLWVADTNNHRIVKVDIAAEKATEIAIR